MRTWKDAACEIAWNYCKTKRKYNEYYEEYDNRFNPKSFLQNEKTNHTFCIPTSITGNFIGFCFVRKFKNFRCAVMESKEKFKSLFMKWLDENCEVK